MLELNSLFNEKSYLLQNQDVANPVMAISKSGKYSSTDQLLTR
jgi:hypothetical protein